MVVADEPLIGIATLPLFEQPALVDTATFSVTLPEVPAVKLIAFVPCPLLIVPLVIVQVKVPPACGAMLALPDVDAQIDDGALMIADGTGLIVTPALPVFVQLVALVTVTESDTVPVEFGLNVIDDVPWPLTSAPLVTVQL